MSQSRQLAAIMFTDIVGYTALMGNDEQKAFVLLDKNRKLQRPVIEAFNGRWIKELGDGVMASFPTVSDAVYAAIKIQENCNAANDFKLRIGIHLGEVVFEDDDVFGDGVNIAARIQSAASPGCIFISEEVHHNVANKKEIETHFVKEEILKNVSQPVRMYQVLFEGGDFISEPPEVLTNTKRKVPGLKSNKSRITIGAFIVSLMMAGFFLYPKFYASGDTIELQKSIAVLPFVNMSDDQEQEFFSDGISEEIINKLAQAPGLKVTGRTSSFAFQGKNMDITLIGKQLNASYILEGSVRKSGNILRITAQLIDVANGYHLYSQTFDKELKDVFAIQDEISLAILEAVKIKLFGSAKDIVLKKYTENVEAYQLYLNGRFYYNKFTPDGFFKAIEYFKAAIALDPDYSIAYSGMAFCYSNLWSYNWLAPEKCLSQWIQAANKALALDDQIAENLLNVGRIKLHYEWKIREAEIEYKKALAINPNFAEIHVQLGFCDALLGNNALAIEHASKAESLDPFSLLNLTYIGFTYWTAGDPEQLLATGKRLVDMEPNFPMGHMFVGISNFLLNNYKEALPEIEMAVKLNSDLLNLSTLGIAYAVIGEKMKAREIIEKMKKIEGADFAGNSYIGVVYGFIGESDTAFQYFDKAIENRETNMLWVKFNFRGMQMDMNDPRVLRLFEKMGQPYL